jgi:hypothetical protein
MKFEFGLWTLSLIGAVIYRKFRVRLTKPSTARVMRILGYMPQKPKYMARQQDPVLVEAWKTNLLPALKDVAKRTGAVIYFADEFGIRSESSRRHNLGTLW